MRVIAVLTTPQAIKDVLFTGQEENINGRLISEGRLKAVVTRGLLSGYSFVNLG